MVDYTILPPETWLLVVEFLATAFPMFDPMAPPPENDAAVLKISTHMRAVSSLSRFFYQIAYPYRFQEIHFKVDPSRSSTLKLRRIEELLDFLEHRPELKTWVRVLSAGRESPSLWRPRGDNFESHYLAVEQRIFKFIPELRRLNSLRCGFMSFPSSVLAGLLQLPQLERLEFEEFRVIQNPSEKTPDWDAVDQHRTALRYLTVNAVGPPSTPTTSAMVHLLKQENLVDLTYRPHVFLQVHRGVSLLWTISSHTPDYVFTSLRQLHIMLPPSDVEAQHFVELGGRCPNLTSLTITWNFLDTTSQLEDRLKRGGLTACHFPALQRFEGPFSLAPIFAQGRPVHTIFSDMFTQLRGADRNENRIPLPLNIAALKPSISLRVLHLVVSRWSDGDIEAIARHHPELEELVYECLETDAMVGDCSDPTHTASIHIFAVGLQCWSTRLEDAFRVLTKLKRLTLENMEDDIPPGDADDDDYLIAKLRGLCPNLRYACISWLGTWRFHSRHKVRKYSCDVHGGEMLTLAVKGLIMNVTKRARIEPSTATQ
ncbi:hypothetical protein FRC01_007657 [Tulasnella sp. 417]|nr:hypothetical protein FRC01_007657 [Tulasnella sp. 417]